ncbi:MAG: putative permease component of transporter [Cyanobacteria bacterium RYN_339]|nr:putative permease component of transporter [Cyanobacteria bacterium RYN_339]
MSLPVVDAPPMPAFEASPPKPRRRAPSPWLILLGLILGSVVLAPWIAAYDPLAQLADGLSPLGAPLPPSAHHWLGTDELGRDVLSRVLHGGRLSLLIAAAATSLAGILGVGCGMVAGYAAGRVDNLLMRATEIVMAFPLLLLAIALASVLPPGPISVVITLGVVGWTSLARVVRGTVLQVREQEFVEASRAVGAGHIRILLQHIWPNVRPLALTLLALKLADMLLLEAALGFLGLGVPPPTPTWGSLVGEARAYFYHAPWLGLPAGAAIFLTVLAVNMLAERATAASRR